MRIPRKLKKLIKKKHIDVLELDRKTKLIIFDVSEDGAWIKPKREQ